MISWDRAKTWDPTMTSFKTQDALTWLACPVEHGPGTYCIENNTESMDDGTRRGYGEGDILFIDPGVPAVPDKDVLVILPDGKMLFRRLKEDSEGPYLLALNGKRMERWKEGTVVQGVVIFSGISR
jgi:SOS-response transcriptional repressor LexA